MTDQRWQRDNTRIIEYYASLLEQHPTSVRALDWGSERSQRLRFAVLTAIGSLHDRSVLDVGCGRGDLLAFLEEQEVPVRYTGYDISPEMVRVAERKFMGHRFKVHDLLAAPEDGEQFDYVFASGIFYLRQQDPDRYLTEMVQKMFRLCRLGVAFNCLSARSVNRDPGEFYADPVVVVASCLEISPRVVLKHDYLPNDFTVYLYKISQ